MDYKNYRQSWRQQEEGDELPKMRLPVAAMHWDLSVGMQPTLRGFSDSFFARNPFKDTRNPAISPELQIRPMGCVHGHNTLADTSFTSLIDVDVNVPISPLFVRDLCGRTIYIGYGPDKKELEEWGSYGADQQVLKGDDIDYPNAQYAEITFPRFCRELPEETPGAELIENVFFCKFRTLDMSLDSLGVPSGGVGELSAGIYSNANLYPYKARLDTFYVDGYKLPQTQMVFAKQDVQPHQARHAVDRLKQAWETRPQSASYDAFVEGLGSEIAALFEEGCTLIPTFEACNGVHKVSRDFELLDYWAGRAVPGLHEIVEVRDDVAPEGTILAVLKPGYVTAWDVEPAQVVISNGRDYKSPNDDDPVPLSPNFALPHQRAAVRWGMLWLPTHPAHFEQPALWGWDGQNGRFLQVRGPLWDPLHYYYACTDIVLKAFETPLPENRWVAEVPEEMENKFYPIVPMMGFDSIDMDTLYARDDERLWPRTSVKRVHSDVMSANIGYHPLPLQFEYELDPYWMPELHPINRAVKLLDEELQALLAPVIESKVQPQRYLETVAAPAECEWLTSINYLRPSQKDALLDYPFLVRYIMMDLPEEEIFEMSEGLFLEDPDEELLTSTPQDLWTDVDDVETLEAFSPGLFDAVWDMREEALRLLRTRHRLYRRNPALYAYAWWVCVDAKVLERFFEDWEAKDAARHAPADKKSIPLGSQVMPVTEIQPELYDDSEKFDWVKDEVS